MFIHKLVLFAQIVRCIVSSTAYQGVFYNTDLVQGKCTGLEFCEASNIKNTRLLADCLRQNCDGFLMSADSKKMVQEGWWLEEEDWKVYRKQGYDPNDIGGGVTFIRREDGSDDFDRNWDEYKSGFGGPDGEMWLGLDKIHYLTSMYNMSLRVDMTAWNYYKKWAIYSHFSVGPESGAYTIQVSGFDSDSIAGDSLLKSFGFPNEINGMKFSTKDNDNDFKENGTCAVVGGWWFNSCHSSLATGLYLLVGELSSNGIYWCSAYDDMYSFKFMQYTLFLRE